MNEPTCQEALAVVDEYVDAELDPHQQDLVTTHLAHCTTCQEAYHGQRALKATVRRACPCEEAPLTLRIRILALVQRSN